MRRIVIDLDDTLTITDPSRSYENKAPNIKMVAKLREYRSQGFEIAIQTARNMRTFQNSIGKINAETLPKIIRWLDEHQVPYDEIYVGKPWCGLDGFYVDDKAIRPNEFLSLNYEQINHLIKSRTEG